MSENTQLQVSQPKPPPMAMGSRGVQLSSYEEAYRFANSVAKSNLAPKDFKTPESILVAIQYGAELGLSPMQSLNRIAVINNRPCVWGDGLKAIVEASPACAWIDETIEGEGDAMVATCKAHRHGRPAPTVRTFSVADARKANLWGKAGPWVQYPKRMLQMRARSFALRDQFPDLLCGIYTAEEVMDMDPPAKGLQSGDVTPATDLDEIVGQLLEAPQNATQATTEPIAGEVEEDPAIDMLFNTAPEPEVYT